VPSLQRALASAGAPGAGGAGGGISLAERFSRVGLGAEATSTPPWWEQAPRPAVEVVPSRQLTLSPSLADALGASALVSLRVELRVEAGPTPPWWEQAPRPEVEVVPSRQLTVSPSPELVGAEDRWVVDSVARTRVEVELRVRVAVAVPTPP
jgi:hypothetical protein